MVIRICHPGLSGLQQGPLGSCLNLLKSLKALVATITALLLLSSCYGKMLPYSEVMKRQYMFKAPNGPPDFQQGWLEGCETGTNAVVSIFYSRMFKTKMNYTKYKNSSDYSAGWDRSYEYCKRINEYYDALYTKSWDR